MFPQELPRALKSFEILQRLGVGGAGEVFLARSKGGRLVAIKVIGDARRGEAQEVLAREASLCARLSHPTIVQVRAYLEDESFTALVFEYVAGVALMRLLRLCASNGVRLPDGAAWHIVERVLSALAYAHSLKDEHQTPTPIVHRDVSPSNVLVDWNGGVKLTDFGIAKMIGVSPSTRMGLVKGTLGCMAPEQARGEPVTERADVYAAGLLAWRLATGRVPFAKHQRDEYELLRAMRNPRIKPLSVLRPDLPEPLLDAVAKALVADPERRTLTALDFAGVVRASFDTTAGCAELAELLARWKLALERSVKRQDGGGAVVDAGDSSESRAAQTLRYEEVALAFNEDEVPDDGPTFEAHALPSDSAIAVALPVESHDAGVDEPPPPDPQPPTWALPLSLPPPPPATFSLPPVVGPRSAPLEQEAPSPVLRSIERERPHLWMRRVAAVGTLVVILVVVWGIVSFLTR